MRRLLRQVVRPVYGKHFHLRPTRWWSRRDRRTTRLMAGVMDAHHEEIYAAVSRVVADAAIYGEGFMPIRWITEDEARQKYGLIGRAYGMPACGCNAERTNIRYCPVHGLGGSPFVP